MSGRERVSIIKNLIMRYLKLRSEDIDGDDTRRQFVDWFEESEGREEKMKVIQDVWDNNKGSRSNLTVDELNDIMIRAGLNKSHATRKAGSKLPLVRIVMRVAAVLVPLLIIGGVWFMTADKPNVNFIADYSAPNGIIQTHDLTDGSNIMINAGSTLAISHDDNRRYAELSGESFFKIAKDEKRPFVVKTEGLTITVLGTEFNVEAYPDQEFTVVTLTEGKVNLETADGKSWTLTPGNQLIYDRQTRVSEIRAVSNIDVTLAWTIGKMFCELKTLSEIFKVAERKYGIVFEIDPDVHLPDLKYTVQFKAEETSENVIEALKIMTDGFDYVLNDRRVIITKLMQ